MNKGFSGSLMKSYLLGDICTAYTSGWRGKVRPDSESFHRNHTLNTANITVMMSDDGMMDGRDILMDRNLHQLVVNIYCPIRIFID